MVSDEALKKLQEQIAAWPITQRFVVQQLIRERVLYAGCIYVVCM